MTNAPREQGVGVADNDFYSNTDQPIKPLFCSGFGQFHSNEETADIKKHYVTIGWNKTRDLVDNPQQVDKTQAQWLIPSTLLSRVFKEQEASGEYWLSWADIDTNPVAIAGIAEIIERLIPGNDFEIYTSKSATQDNQKCRVLIPLSKPLCWADWSLCQEILNDHLQSNGIEPDRASERAAQLCYLPNRGAFYDSKSKRDGKYFDPMLAWADAIQTKKDTAEIQAKELEILRKASISRKEALRLNSSTSAYPSLIDEFNACYTVEDILLRANYCQHPRKRNLFRHPGSESGSYSASIKDGRVNSLSSSDPLYNDGQGAHDAFSAFKVLFHHNDENAALKDAGDNLMIGTEPWNTVKRREYAQQKQQEQDTGADAATEGKELEAVISLDEAKLPAWPDDVLPGSIQDFVTALSKSTETPPELSAMMVLAAISAATQGKYRVRVKADYFEPVNIWACAALPPGSRKTAVQTAATAPLSKWEKLQRENLEPTIKKAQADDATLRERINHLRKKAASAKESEFEKLKKEIAGIEANLPEIPTVPQIWAQDVTPENLGTIMADNNERMAILSDEAGIFDILGGRYSGGIPNLDLFLQSHAGSAVRVNRGSRPPVFMQTPALTFGLSPQPEALRGLTEKPSFRGRGLLGRFLYVLPPSNLGYRTLDASPIFPDYCARYEGILTCILNQEMAGSKEEPSPHILKITDDALKAWQIFARKIEAGMREDGIYAHLTDWAGKLPGAVVRVAALLHIARYALVRPWEKEISIEDMSAAVRIADVLSIHALAVFDLMGADPALDGARHVLRWIKREGKPEFTFRDCYQYTKSRYKRTAELEPVIAVLIERFIIRPKTVKVAHRPSRLFEVNPAIFEKDV